LAVAFISGGGGPCHPSQSSQVPVAQIAPPTRRVVNYCARRAQFIIKGREQVAAVASWDATWREPGALSICVCAEHFGSMQINVLAISLGERESLRIICAPECRVTGDLININ
jgi:hypothetical protein